MKAEKPLLTAKDVAKIKLLIQYEAKYPIMDRLARVEKRLEKLEKK